MTKCRWLSGTTPLAESSTGEVTLSISSQEPSLLVLSMSQEDCVMVSLLTRRLLMYIGVQASVETILGAIFQTYIRNGYIDGQDKKTNLRNIFDDSIIARILDYYGEVPEVMNIINKHCYIKDDQPDPGQSSSQTNAKCCACVIS